MWLPKFGGTFDYASGMTEGMKNYVDLLRARDHEKITGEGNMSNGQGNIADESQRILDHNAELKQSDGYGTYTYYDPVDDATSSYKF